MATSINDILTDPVKRESLETRFWSKVSRRGPKACWPWTAKARHRFGYGAINSGRGNFFLSHVVSYAINKGRVPHGAYVLHSCDNPGCCNPSHLRLGTHLENVRDIKERGRLKGRTGPVDPKMCARKLDAATARLVKYSKMTRKEAADHFGISLGSVDNIRSGRTWARV